MRRSRIVLAASFLLYLLLAAAPNLLAAQNSEEWASISKDIYIKAGSVARTSGSAVSLWVKIIPEDNSDLLTQAVEHFMKKGRDDKALAYYYSGLLIEMDCINDSHRELVTILYDINKNILDSTDHSKASWQVTPSEGSIQLVHEAVCHGSLPLAAYKFTPERSGC